MTKQFRHETPMKIINNIKWLLWVYIGEMHEQIKWSSSSNNQLTHNEIDNFNKNKRLKICTSTWSVWYHQLADGCIGTATTCYNKGFGIATPIPMPVLHWNNTMRLYCLVPVIFESMPSTMVSATRKQWSIGVQKIGHSTSY